MTVGPRRALALLLLGASCRCAPPPGPAHWRTIGPGLEYASADAGDTLFHLVRVDLTRERLQVVDARNAVRQVAEVADLARESGALVAINGTFFDERRRPIGLVVSQGRELNPLHRTRWFGALVVREVGGFQQAEVVSTEQLLALGAQKRSLLSVALQVGPRAVAGGRALPLKRQRASRSAVCVQSPTRILLLATENAPVDAGDLARWMAEPADRGGFGCTSALLLDGGPSVQLAVHTASFDFDLRGGWGVPNALVVLPR